MQANRLIDYVARVAMTLILTGAGTAMGQESEAPADPTIRKVQAGDTINVARLPDKVYLRDVNDPDDIIWDRIPTYRIYMTMAPPVHPSVKLRFDPSQAKHLYFQLARTADRFYARLRWQDPSENRKTTSSEFRDGVALQFSLGGEDTSYMMGSGPDQPVNIWYWRADKETIENLAAGGYGSTTRLPDQPVSGESSYTEARSKQNNQWRVVMSRKLKSEGGHQIDLREGKVPMAFALWQGAEGQRDGNKRVSHNWLLVDMHPDREAGGERPPASGSREDRANERAEAADKKAAEQPEKADGNDESDADGEDQGPKGLEFY